LVEGGLRLFARTVSTLVAIQPDQRRRHVLCRGGGFHKRWQDRGSRCYDAKLLEQLSPIEVHGSILLSARTVSLENSSLFFKLRNLG
jgi:hypothetical protein